MSLELSVLIPSPPSATGVTMLLLDGEALMDNLELIIMLQSVWVFAEWPVS